MEYSREVWSTVWSTAGKYGVLQGSMEYSREEVWSTAVKKYGVQQRSMEYSRDVWSTAGKKYGVQQGRSME